MTRALLITSARQNDWIADESNPAVTALHEFAEAVQRTSETVQLFLTSLDRLQFIISNDGVQILDETTGRDIATYDILHLRGVDRTMGFYADYAKAIALYAEYHSKIIIDSKDVGAAFGKLSQAMLFALHDVPTPRTYAQWNGSDLARLVRQQQATFPLVVKASMGTMGVDNYLVQTAEELRAVLDDTKEPFIVQEMIQNCGDYRILLLGSARPLVFWRPQVDGSHLSNTSQGSIPDKDVVLDAEVMELALHVQSLVGRAVVGVDVMQDSQTGNWIVLEANTNPALATGAFTEDKAERYASMIKDIVRGRVL